MKLQFKKPFSHINNMQIWKKLFLWFGLANCISVILTIFVLLQINNIYRPNVNWDSLSEEARGDYLSSGKDGLTIFAHALQSQGIVINLIKNGEQLLAKTGPVDGHDYTERVVNSKLKYTEFKIAQDINLMGIDLGFIGFNHYHFIGFIVRPPLDSHAINTLGMELIFSLIFIALMGYWLAYRIATPIQHIKDAAVSLGNGNLNTYINEAKFSKDEVGELATTFNKMAGQIKETIKNKKQLLWNISHELRSPLNRLNFILTLVQDDKNQINNDYLQKAKDEITNLDQIIEATLTLSRLEHSYDSGEKEIIVLQKILNERIEAIQSYNEDKGINFILRYPIKEIRVLANTLLFSMVIDNIFDNAFKFSPNNSKIILTVDKNNENKAIITIEDEGVGVPAGELDKIFQPFFRSTNSTAITGYGLGLSIVKQIINMHNGEIFARNRSGTTGFCIEIQMPTVNYIKSPNFQSFQIMDKSAPTS